MRTNHLLALHPSLDLPAQLHTVVHIYTADHMQPIEAQALWGKMQPRANYRLAAAMLLVDLLGRPGLSCAALLLLVPTPAVLDGDVGTGPLAAALASLCGVCAGADAAAEGSLGLGLAPFMGGWTLGCSAGALLTGAAASALGAAAVPPVPSPPVGVCPTLWLSALISCSNAEAVGAGAGASCLTARGSAVAGWEVLGCPGCWNGATWVGSWAGAAPLLSFCTSLAGAGAPAGAAGAGTLKAGGTAADSCGCCRMGAAAGVAAAVGIAAAAGAAAGSTTAGPDAGRETAAGCSKIGVAELTAAAGVAAADGPTSATAGICRGFCCGCGCGCDCCCTGAMPGMGSGSGMERGAEEGTAAGAAADMASARGALVAKAGAGMAAALPCCPNIGPDESPAIVPESVGSCPPFSYNKYCCAEEGSLHGVHNDLILMQACVKDGSPVEGGTYENWHTPLATALGRKLFASSTFSRTGRGGICCMTPCTHGANQPILNDAPCTG